MLGGAGHCTFADRSRLQLIDVRHENCNRFENYPPYIVETLACLSDRPLLNINGSTLGSQLTVLRTAWVGLGPRCRGTVPGCYEPGGGRVPPTPQLMGAWRHLLGQCFGIHSDKPAPLSPARLLVVDRLYESGRYVCALGVPALQC